MLERDLLGLGRGDGGLGGSAGVPQVVDGVILQVVVHAEDGAGSGVDVVIILGVAGVELHLVDHAPVVEVQAGLEEDGLGGGDAGVGKGDLLGLVSGDIGGGGGVGGQGHLAGGELGGVLVGHIGHVQAGGLAHGPDGAIDGAVVVEEGHFVALLILGGEAGAVDGDADVVAHGDSAAGGQGGHAKTDGQGGNQDAGNETSDKSSVLHSLILLFFPPGAGCCWFCVLLP